MHLHNLRFPIKLDYSDRDIKKYYTERSQGRLVIFGDSFAETSTRNDTEETCWIFVLAQNLIELFYIKL